MVFSSVGGPAYVMDLDRGRRDGTLQDMQDMQDFIDSIRVPAGEVQNIEGAAAH